MTSSNCSLRMRPVWALALSSITGIALTVHFLPAQTADSSQKALEPSFAQIVKPFFKKNCLTCHNTDTSTAGIRVDQLDTILEDRHLRVWEAIRKRVREGT